MNKLINISFYFNLVSIAIWSVIWFSFTNITNNSLLIGYIFTIFVIILHYISIKNLLGNTELSKDKKFDIIESNIHYYNKSVTNIPPIIFAIANIYQFSKSRQLKLVDHFILVILFGVIIPFITESLIFDNIGEIGIVIQENFTWNSISYSLGFLITAITHNFLL